jgi:hypothetical protein
MTTTTTLHPNLRRALKVAKLLLIVLFGLAVVLVLVVIRCGTVPNPDQRRTRFLIVGLGRRPARY